MSQQRRTWEKAFLSALEKTGSIAGSAKAAKAGRQTVYDHMKADPDFADKCREALDTAEDSLETELRRRAVEGEQVPVYFKGQGRRSQLQEKRLAAGVRHQEPAAAS